MNQQGKFYSLYHFTCKNCQKEFYNANGYSPSANIAETYCVNCTNLKYFNLGFRTQHNNLSSFSSNFYSVNSETNLSPNQTELKRELDKTNKQALEVKSQKSNFRLSETTFKDRRVTGRTKQLNLRVKEKTYWKLKELASKNKCLMTEMMEKLLEGYEKKAHKTK